MKTSCERQSGMMSAEQTDVENVERGESSEKPRPRRRRRAVNQRTSLPYSRGTNFRGRGANCQIANCFNRMMYERISMLIKSETLLVLGAISILISYYAC